MIIVSYIRLRVTVCYFFLVYDRDDRKRSLFVFLGPRLRNFDYRKQVLTFFSNFLRNCGKFSRNLEQLVEIKPQNIAIANHSINKSGPSFSEEGRMGVGQFENIPVQHKKCVQVEP